MSYAQFHPSELGPGGHALLRLLNTFGLVTMETGLGDKKDEMRVNNLTLINLVIKFVGPTHEQTLTCYMLAGQVGPASHL